MRQCLVFVSEVKKYCCSLGSVLEKNVCYGWEILGGASGDAQGVVPSMETCLQVHQAFASAATSKTFFLFLFPQYFCVRVAFCIFFSETKGN